jgi:nitronate monooxygenase
MLTTRFTELVGCTAPIQQAPMGALANPKLAAAIANAGGLGMVAAYSIPWDMTADVLDDLAEHTPGVFGANYITHFTRPERLHELIGIAAERSRVVDFFWSDPDPVLVDIVHARGGLASWQVGSRDEALAAEAAGCDFIVAQGIGAGGHVLGQIGVLALLDEVLEAVSIPVLAAGGIGSGRTLAAVLAAGADGARMGTRFIVAEEAGAHPTYVNALIAARGGVDTIYTEAFSGGWPDAPHRVLRSSFDAAHASTSAVLGESDSYYTDARYPVERFDSMTATAGTTGDIEAMSLWAGEAVSNLTRVQPAGDILREIVEEAERLLRRW